LNLTFLNTKITPFFIDFNLFFLYFVVLFLLFLFFKLAFTLYTLSNHKFSKSNQATKGINYKLNINNNLLVFVQQVWTLPTFFLFLSWNSPTISIFSNHFFFTNYSIYTLLFCLVFQVMLLSVFLVYKNQTSVSLNTKILSFFLLNSLLVLLFILTCVVNIVSFVFTLELVNLIVIAFLANSLIHTKNSINTAGNAFIIFFWVNTLSSILLFIFLIYMNYFQYPLDFNWVSFSIDFVDTTFYILKIKPILDYCLFFILFFKLGLPPFLIWKVYVFEKASLLFLLFYNAPYFFFLFLNLIYLVFLLKFSLLNTNYTIFVFFVGVNFLIISVLSVRTTNWGYFFAISSSFTALLILLVLIFSIKNQTNGFYINTLTFKTTTSMLLPYINYFYIYILTIFVLIPKLLNLGILQGSSTISMFAKGLNTFKSAFFKERTLLFILIGSLAGLPPLSSFFAKLFLINSVIVSSSPFFPFFLSLLFYIFLMLLFYFKASKFLLVQTSLRFPKLIINNKFTAGSGNALNLKSLNNSLRTFFFNFIFLWVLVFGLFIFSDLIIFLSL